LIRNINNIITLHQNKLKNVTVYKQFEESVEIEGYPDELTQVWTNLISNATYANKYRGNLWIRVKQYENKVQVDIEDSGGGVDPQVMERIFEPFETTKPEGEGTGLGLSITKRVIDKHKGTITVGNTETGALFSVTLPKTLP
ncbi:MAG: ATP-binding protein, partial [Bacteroidota bacterium]